MFNSLFITLFPYFCVLSLSAIAIILTERVGIINLGINGTVVIGATFYAFAAYKIGPIENGEMSAWYNIPLYAIAAIGGILFSLLYGFITIKLKGNQTIAGIAMNILAPAITLVVVYLFGEANRLESSILPRLEFGNSSNYELKSIISLKTFVAFIIIIISFIVLTFTKWGLRFRSIGENPQAADTAGINVNRMKWQAIIISGAIAGIAGAIFITECTTSPSSIWSKVNAEGLGFLAISIVIISRWKILWSSLVAVFFSLLISAGQRSSDLFGEKGIEMQYILMMLPYLFTLIVLIIFSKPVLFWLSKLFSNLHNKFSKNKTNSIFSSISNKFLNMSNTSNGPKALGEPYDKSKR